MPNEEKLYDFYFSAKHKKHVDYYYSTGAIIGKRGPTCFFKGQEYTECIAKGRTPLSSLSGSFDDLVKIATGTLKDCTFVPR